MKKQNGFNLIVFLTVSIIIFACSEGNKKTSKPGIVNQESNSNQELELPQKRIVYQIPEMEDVICHKGIIYHSVNGIDLKADVYVPPSNNKSDIWPLVILVSDYPDSVVNHYWGRDQKDMELFVSWAELIAASGIAAVTYQTQFSHFETDSLIAFLRKHSEKYNIDMNRLGVFGCSANTLATQSLMQNDKNNIKCAVLYYGILLTPDNKYYAAIDSSASMYGFYWSDLRPITAIPTDIPLLVTKAGKDQFRIVTETTDYYVTEAMKSNAQLTYIHYHNLNPLFCSF